MNTLHPTIKYFSFSRSTKKLQIIAFLLTALFTLVTVPAAQADLPPETYYQGIDTGINGDDEGSGALPIGFDFDFYGHTYSQFYVASNGMITFNDYRYSVGWGNWPYYVNGSIPNNNWPNNYIAPFWDDITADNDLDQRVLYKTIGTAPNRRVVVQYTNVGFWNDPTPLGTFFVILYEGSNNIQFQYRYLIGDNARAHGASATVGLENANGTAGKQYSFNTDSLASEQVILFMPDGSGGYNISTDSYEPVLLGLGTTPTPHIPIQTNPLKGATVSTTPTFSWGAAENATSYEIRVDNNANMGSLEIHETGITDTSFTPTTPLAEGTYYWIVIAHNANDQAWSHQWNFTASNNPPPPLPGVPLLVSPNQDEVEVSLTPTFSWQAASDADEYQLIVSEQADLSAPLIEQSGILTTSFDATGLTADTLYYWSVIASNITGSTQSSLRSFTSLHINKAPTANNDTETVAEDSGTTSIDVLANDTDPDIQDTLSILAVGTPNNGGTAVINNNQVNYTPATNFFGTETFIYSIDDGNDGSDTATVTIQVTSVNDLPTANNDSEIVAEDSDTITIDVLSNDTDLDTADTLSITAVGAPNNGGTAVRNNDQIDYTPALNFFGTETFSYTIRDGNGGTDSATVTITVTAINDAPTASDDSETIAEDVDTTSFDVLANDTDLDVGDTLAIASIGATVNGGTAVINNNQIDYTPALNFFGTDSFTYTISDSNGGSDSATVTIEITAVNDLPTADDDSETVAEDSGTTSINVLSNDTDADTGDTLSISAVGTPDNGGTAVINNNQIDYTPAPNFFGTDTFTYTISDGNGGSDLATVTIEVSAVNDLPTADDDSATVAEDSGTTPINVLANDTDPDTADTLSISTIGTPNNGGTAVINNDQIDYTPALDFFGTETFTYTISDGNGGSDTAIVTITVTEVNDAPTANDDGTTIAEDGDTISIDILSNDTDPNVEDTLSITFVSNPDHGGTAVLNNDQIDYTPALDFFGTETFTYTISDGNGGSDSATVTLTVTPVNDAPTANDDTQTIAEDSGTAQIDVLANDSDLDSGDVLSISFVSTPDNGGTAVLNNNQIDYTPASNFFGSETFTYTVSDGSGGSDSATVTIEVTAVNDLPIANDDSDTIAENGSTIQLNVLTNDNDPDTGDVLSIVSVDTPNNGGTAVLNNDQIDYTPAPNFFGIETFTYTINDGNGGSDSATVTITVTEINDVPTANDDSATAVEDSSTIQIDVLANDTDLNTNDVLSISSVGQTDNGGTAVINNNQIDYTPAPNFFGSETFTYTVSDGRSGSDTATVTIEVTAVNDAPTANDDSETASEESGTIQIDVLANDEDIDVGDILTISAVSTPDNGGTAVINNNQIAYTAAPGFVGSETFTYTISDGNGGSDTATVTMTIYLSHSNAAPNAHNDLPETLEDSPIIIDVLANDDDPDGDSLSILAVGEAVHGTAVIQGSRIKYTPDANFHGSDSFTYTVGDGEFTDTATVTITVVSVNDLPQAALDSATTKAGSSIVIRVLDNDSDPVEGNRLTITSVANPAHGTATTNGTTITYKPDTGFVGTETFTYTLSDGTDSVTGTITVTVNPYQIFIPLVIK